MTHMPENARADWSAQPAYLLLPSKQQVLRLQKTKLGFVTDPEGISDVVVSRNLQGNDCTLGFQGIDLSEGELPDAKIFDGETSDIRASPLALRVGNLPSALLQWHCPVAPKQPRRMCWLRVSTESRSQNILPDGVGLFGFGWVNYTSVALQFAGDLNRDMHLDFVVNWSTSGGAYCSGTTLFLSDRASRDHIVKVAATDSWCD